jgi:hypothetical protein
LEKCHPIRKYLAPLFGPDFVDACVPVKPEDEPTKRRPGRRPKSPPVAIKRSFEDDFDEDEEPPPKQHESKRRAVRSCATGLVFPPPLPYNLDMDQYNVNIDEICSMMSAARELMRLQHCPWDGPPMNDWPIPGDPRLGGVIYHQGRRYKWNGANHLQAKPDTPPPTLPPVAPLIHPTIPPAHYTRFPITPSPHQSPLVPSSLEFQSPYSTAAGRTLISPPMSLRESFNGFGPERQYSVVTTDECHTPVREYFGSLFTPQPENERYEDEC